MNEPKRPAFRMGWRISGNDKWGREVVISDPRENQTACIWLLPADGVTYSWNNANEAREAAVAALRELADRIERGEE